MTSNPNVQELSPEQILINGIILVNGILTCETRSKMKKDELGIPHQIITIRGTLNTDYYIEELNVLESDRYYISGIEVTREIIDSSLKEIEYKFTAQTFQVKWQDTDTFKVISLEENNDGKQQ